MKNLNSTILNNKDLRQQYDANVKKLLSEKYILAWILKECVEEFKEFSIDTILNKAFLDDTKISTEAVDQDENDLDEATQLEMANSEDKSIKEGLAYYDIRFTAAVPNTDKKVFLIINIEAQKDDKTKYHILKRALYYCSRLISAQKNKVFAKNHYEKIRKVYSIWIQINVSDKKQNTINKYSIAEHNLFGSAHEPKEAYDMLNILLLRLGKESESNSQILKLLNILLKSKQSPEEKKQVLEKDYSIQFNSTLKEEVKTMCNLGDGIYEEGIEKGILKTLKNLVNDGIIALKVAAEKANMSEALFLEKTAKL